MSNDHVLMTSCCVKISLVPRSLEADSRSSLEEEEVSEVEDETGGTKAEWSSRSILRFDGSTGTSSSFVDMEISLNNASLCFSQEAEDLTSYSSPELPNNLAPFLINLFTPNCFSALIVNVVGGTYEYDCTVDAASPSNLEDASDFVNCLFFILEGERERERERDERERERER